MNCLDILIYSHCESSPIVLLVNIEGSRIQLISITLDLITEKLFNFIELFRGIIFFRILYFVNFEMAFRKFPWNF